MQDLKAQLEVKGNEIRSLQSSLESMKSVNEELKVGMAASSSHFGADGDDWLSRTARLCRNVRRN